MWILIMFVFTNGQMEIKELREYSTLDKCMGVKEMLKKNNQVNTDCIKKEVE